MHEADMHDDNMFLTITYDDEHLPKNKSLNKKHIQDFMKRFRQEIGKKVKYYMCGEYGEKTARPHYHFIIFGYYPTKQDMYYCSYSSGRRRFASRTIEKLWKFGNNVVEEVNRLTCEYTAKYIQKKLYGEEAEKMYIGVEAPFSLMSKGLGLNYLGEHLDEIIDRGIVQEGVKLSLPRYYIQKLKPFTDLWYLPAIENGNTAIKQRLGDIVKAEKTKKIYNLCEVKRMKDEDSRQRERLLNKWASMYDPVF